MKTLNFTRGQIVKELILDDDFLESDAEPELDVTFLEENDESILIFISGEDGGMTDKEKYINLTIKDVQHGNYDYDDCSLEEGLVILNKNEDETITTCLEYNVRLTANGIENE